MSSCNWLLIEPTYGKSASHSDAIARIGGRSRKISSHQPKIVSSHPPMAIKMLSIPWDAIERRGKRSRMAGCSFVMKEPNHAMTLQHGEAERTSIRMLSPD